MFRSLLIFSLLITLGLCYGFGDDEESSGVFGKLKSGLKLAGKLLGLDVASEVTKLVSESFGKNSKKGDSGSAGANIFSGFFRLLGLEPKKIGAIAVNALVFIAQLISTSLSRPGPPELTHARKLRLGSPFEWITNNPNEKISELLKAAKDPELPNQLVQYLKARSKDEQTGCVQLLVCKSAPFLWGMQKAINEKVENLATGTSGMYKHLPSAEEISGHGDECEEKFPTCYLD